MASRKGTSLERLLRRPDFLSDGFEEDLRMNDRILELTYRQENRAMTILDTKEIKNKWDFDPKTSKDSGEQATRIKRKETPRDGDSRKSSKKKNGESYSLYLQGNCHEDQEIVSCVSARIMQNRRKDPLAIVLGYFCHSKKYSEDGEGLVCGMLQSLIGQLLNQAQEHGLNICFEDSKVRGQLNSRTYLRELLKDSIDQLPPQMQVYCILDRIETYDHKEYALKDFKKFIRDFSSYMTSISDPPHVKLLLTTAGNCSQICKETMNRDNKDGVYYRGEECDTHAEQDKEKIKVDRWLYIPDS